MAKNRLFFWTVLLFMMWMILTANIQIANIFIGLSVSYAVALLYTRMFKESDFHPINPYWVGIYLWVLAKNLIISNIQITQRTLSKDMKLAPAIVAVKTELKSDWKKLLLANSVTLTPGTLTLDIREDTLYIHIIECKDIKDGAYITKEFEEIIAKI